MHFLVLALHCVWGHLAVDLCFLEEVKSEETQTVNVGRMLFDDKGYRGGCLERMVSIEQLLLFLAFYFLCFLLFTSVEVLSIEHLPMCQKVDSFHLNTTESTF